MGARQLLLKGALPGPAMSLNHFPLKRKLVTLCSKPIIIPSQAFRRSNGTFPIRPPRQVKGTVAGIRQLEWQV